MIGGAFDLANASPEQLEAWIDGREHGQRGGFDLGYGLGWHEGWAAAEAELAALQRRAHGIVTAASKLRPWAEEQQRRRDRMVEAERSTARRLDEIRHDQAALPREVA